MLPVSWLSEWDRHEEIEAAVSYLEPTVYRRAVWIDDEGEKSFSWEDDLPLWFHIPQMTWRQAMCKGLVEGTPPIIYHYTSPEAFLGIIETGDLWMSDYSYLNDVVELTHGLGIAQERFECAARRLPQAADILRRWRESAATLNCRVCVASFSRDGDSLSQWRAYGPIAVGFRSGALPLGYSKSVFARPVVYDPHIQCRLLDLLAHLCASAYAGDLEQHPDKIERLYEDGTDRILDMVAFFKNKAFEDEREVRMVYIENPVHYADIGLERAPNKFRTGSGLIIPYVTTRDCAQDYPDELPIEEVIIGPSSHADVLYRGVKELLSKHGYASVQVSRSMVPLRS